MLHFTRANRLCANVAPVWVGLFLLVLCNTVAVGFLLLFFCLRPPLL